MSSKSPIGINSDVLKTKAAAERPMSGSHCRRVSEDDVAILHNLYMDNAPNNAFMFGANSLAPAKMAEGWRSGEVCAYMSHIVRRGGIFSKKILRM